jgi:arginine/lysine/ornithine decarboxylase
MLSPPRRRIPAAPSVRAYSATRSLGGRIVVQRSVQSGVIAGLVIAGLQAAFVQPSIDSNLGIAHGITRKALPDTVAAHPDAGAWREGDVVS